MRPNLRPAERAIGISRQEGDGVRNLSLPLQESLEGRVLGSNDGTRFRVVADTLANGEPRLRRWTPVVGPIGDCGIKHIGHGDSSFKACGRCRGFCVSAAANFLFEGQMYDRFLRTTIRDNVDGA